LHFVCRSGLGPQKQPWHPERARNRHKGDHHNLSTMMITCAASLRRKQQPLKAMSPFVTELSLTKGTSAATTGLNEIMNIRGANRDADGSTTENPAESIVETGAPLLELFPNAAIIAGDIEVADEMTSLGSFTDLGFENLEEDQVITGRSTNTRKNGVCGHNQNSSTSITKSTPTTDVTTLQGKELATVTPGTRPSLHLIEKKLQPASLMELRMPRAQDPEGTEGIQDLPGDMGSAAVLDHDNVSNRTKKHKAASDEAMVAPSDAHSGHPEPHLQEKDINRKKDMVCGQGSEDQGLKNWWDFVEEARREIESLVDKSEKDSEIKSKALQINKEVKSNGGRFINYKEPKRDTKHFFEMADDDALKLTEEALRRKYVDYDELIDVIRGRGGGGNNGPGTNTYRKDIRDRLERYDIPVGPGERHLKTDISREVVELVYARGGKYITDENSVKGKFYRVSENLVEEKKELLKRTSQCFRDEILKRKRKAAAKAEQSTRNKKPKTRK
jgi:hypothetical protein